MTKFESLLELQPNRQPFIFMDKVIKVEPKSIAITQKYLSRNEWFFKCHWKGDPNMPGMLQLESMSQTASLCLFSCTPPPEKLYLVSVNKALFRKKITPGEIIETTSKLTSQVRNIFKFQCRIKSTESEKTISKADIDLVWPN